ARRENLQERGAVEFRHHQRFAAPPGHVLRRWAVLRAHGGGVHPQPRIHRAAAPVPQQNRAAGQHAGLTLAQWTQDFQGERAMGLRDNAIVAYAETKVMEKSDRDAWVLS